MDSDSPLLDLYHADRRLEFMRRRLAAIPDELGGLDAEAREREALRERREEEAQELATALVRLEAEIAQVDAELARLGRQTSDVSSMEALAANRKALERCTSRKSDFEEKLLVKLEAQEILAREDALRAERDGADARALAAARGELDSEQADLLRDREETLARRETLIAALEAPLRRRYLRVASGHAHRSLVPLSGDSCGGCGEAMPAQLALDVREGGAVVACEGCGRLVLRTEPR